MGQRATIEQVRGTYPGAGEFDTGVMLAMRQASQLVDRAYGASDTSELALNVEILVAAAMLYMSNDKGSIKSERYAEGSVGYQDRPDGSSAPGLWETPFGRRALLLDTSGKLQGLGRRQVKMAVLDRRY